MIETLFRNLAVLAKELRTRMRGRRAAVVITAYLLLLSALGGMMLYSQLQELRSGLNPVMAASVGQQLFGTLSQVQLFLVIFIVPGLTGPAIAGERDRQTLELLLSTQVSSLWIVLVLSQVRSAVGTGTTGRTPASDSGWETPGPSHLQGPGSPQERRRLAGSPSG